MRTYINIKMNDYVQAIYKTHFDYSAIILFGPNILTGNSLGLRATIPYGIFCGNKKYIFEL